MSHYGNYKPDFELKYDEPFLGSLRRFVSKVAQLIVRAIKRAGRAVSVAVAGAILSCLMLDGCRTQQIPVESKTEVRIVDSVVLKDSVVIIPTERIVDIVPWYDTLMMSTSISESKAWVDTANHTIKGELRNKQGKLVEIKYVDRVVKSDSIVEKEVPVYVKGDTVERIKRPWWSWVCLTWTIVTLCSIAFVIFKKIRELV